uniref:Uncharacterized protein n=1 Tax=Romanomermis culicivorax TaxID=13658 RepID=A0A915L825_ROMCU
EPEDNTSTGTHAWDIPRLLVGQKPAGHWIPISTKGIPSAPGPEHKMSKGLLGGARVVPPLATIR